MAGDWIKVEKATARKPEILQMSEILGIAPDHAFGLCFRFWSWCDDQLKTCHAIGVTNVTLDAVIGHAGFATALIKVGWLEVRSGSLSIPNFDRHLSDSAKNRAQSGKRKQKQRLDSPEMSRSERDKNETKAGPEKRREEYSISIGDEVVVPEKMQRQDVQQAASMWFKHLDVVAPDKVPITNSPQMEAFWREVSKLGPEKFIRQVEHCVSRGWINLREVDEPKQGRYGRQSENTSSGSTGAVDRARQKVERAAARINGETL